MDYRIYESLSYGGNLRYICLNLALKLSKLPKGFQTKS